MKSSRKISLLLGPLLFFIAIYLIPASVFPFPSRVVIGTVVWMAIWWIALPVHTGVTALLPLVVNSFFLVAGQSLLLNNYMSDTVLLVFASNIVALTWEQTQLDKRIALRVLSLVGPSLRQQVAAWFLLATVLSSLLPNIVVCAMLLPIAAAMLKFSGAGDVPKCKASCLILTSIAWGASVGGMATPLGGAMNLVAVAYLEQLRKGEFLYTSWVLHVLPLFLFLTLAITTTLVLMVGKRGSLSGTKQYFTDRYTELPPLSRDEIVSGVLFLFPAALVFIRPLYAAYLPGFKSSYVFVFFAVLSFIISGQDGKPMQTWSEMQKNVSWGLLFLLGGGLSIGTLLIETGTTQIIADMTRSVYLSGGIGTLFFFNLFTMGMAEISSNTTAASIAFPIISSIAKGIGRNPLPYLYTNISAFNSSFMMPTSFRSMPVAHGVPPKFIMRYGLLLSAVSLLCTTVGGYVILKILPGFMTSF